jgi:hypothetical protein
LQSDKQLKNINIGRESKKKYNAYEKNATTIIEKESGNEINKSL